MRHTHFGNRWSLLLACLGTALLIGALQPAQAQAKWKTGEDMHSAVAEAVGAAKAIADVGNYGFKSGICLFGAFLDPDGEIANTEELEAGKKYLVIGGGDADVADMDITVSAGETVLGKDEDEDGTPYVHFVCKQDTAVTIGIKLTDAPHSSFCAIAILEEGGYDVPLDNLEKAVENVLQYADTVAEVTDGASFLSGGGSDWSVFGSLLDEGESVTLGNIALPEGEHIALGACDDQSTDVDIEILKDDGAAFAEDTDDDATPLVLYKTGEGRYGVKLTNETGAASLILTCLLEPPQ